MNSYNYTDQAFQSVHGNQEYQGQLDENLVLEFGQEYQSGLANNIREFFSSYQEKHCSLREGYENTKKIFKDFDDSNKPSMFNLWKNNEHFSEDIEQTIDVVKLFFDLRNPYALNNFHLIIYTTLRVEQ